MHVQTNNKPRLNCVAILGVGLLGGSLGAALKKEGYADRVVGIGRNIARLKKGVKCGAIDSYEMDLNAGIRQADLLVIATPVETIVPFAEATFHAAGNRMMVTDVGSTKGEIIKQLQPSMKKGLRFVGAHPIAGKEKQGIQNMNPALFHNRLCMLTPVSENSKQDIRLVKQMWTAVGAEVVETTPARHDKILARTSHLPHLAASALLNVIPPDMIKISGSGLSDTTRIASGDPELWRGILSMNSQETARSLRAYMKELERMADALEQEKFTVVQQKLEQAKRIRDTLLKKGH